MSNEKGNMKKLKGKAEAQDKDDTEKFAEYLANMAGHLNWEEREIESTDPEAKMVLHQIALEVRLQSLEKKHQDLIDNLRIFIDKEEA